MAIVPHSAVLRHAYDYWLKQYDVVGGVPRRTDIDIAALKPCLGRMLLLGVADPLEESRYLVFGTTLVTYFREELTGLRLGDTGGAKNRVLIEEYRELVRRAEPMMFSNDPVIGGSVFSYEKVALPLRGPDGGVAYILAVIDQLPAL
jgi:hypothetical protein